jgi:hypothetical protein
VGVAGRLADLAEGGAAAALAGDQGEGGVEHTMMRKFAAFALGTAGKGAGISLRFHCQELLLTYLLTD